MLEMNMNHAQFLRAELFTERALSLQLRIPVVHAHDQMRSQCQHCVGRPR